MIKALEKLGVQGTYLNIIKVTYYNSTANIMLDIENLKNIFTKIRNKTEYPDFSLSFNIAV